MINANARSAQGRQGGADLPPCDLVLKGGITSGVVYPKLISELAGKYRFKNIGGTSAGAIAAAGCAAAEYGRQHDNLKSFDDLSALPAKLGQAVDGAKDGNSMLFHLFQPVPELRKHFNVLVSMLNAKPLAAAATAVPALLHQFWIASLAGALLALLMFMPLVMMAAPQLTAWPVVGCALFILLLWTLWVGFGLGRLRSGVVLSISSGTVWWAVGVIGTGVVLSLLAPAPSLGRLILSACAGGISALLVVGLVFVVVGTYFGITLLGGLHRNFYGICSGRGAGESTRPAALTDWLTEYLNSLAGLPEDEPLTFGHLWSSTRSDVDVSARMDPSLRIINLEVMTTAVSQRMCYAIPFRREIQANLYYDPDEWKRIFPQSVMSW
ncbi:MAG: patatin-like phospholipase family protein, partial [Anaerolineae bacterium]|nr:patatin-like phospholipase family protein [Anaerolineae bacterium]